MVVPIVITTLIFLNIMNITTSQEFIIDFESTINMLRIPKKCYHICKQGSCFYENCNAAVSCPGGACHFINCDNASCSGGGCIFEKSIGSTCNGGSCTFKNVEETLKPGFCDGGNCNIEGVFIPDLSSYLTI